MATIRVGSLDPALLREILPGAEDYDLVAMIKVGYPAPESQPSAMHDVRKAMGESVTKVEKGCFLGKIPWLCKLVIVCYLEVLVFVVIDGLLGSLDRVIIVICYYYPILFTMYKSHRSFYTPTEDTIVWHYYSLTKFIGLLESSALLFSRQDQFDDAGEGHLSQWDKDFLSRYPGSIAEYMEGDRLGCFYANCWTMYDSDEYVLWNTYASLFDGVAVKTTVGRLKDSLDKEDERLVYIAEVQYYDEIDGSVFKASDGIINQLALGFSKRTYFRAEKELRLLYHDKDARLNDGNSRNVSFNVNLNRMLEAVYVAPKSYAWFKDAVTHLLSLYGLPGIPVLKSHI